MCGRANGYEEFPYVTTQGARDTERVARPATGGRRGQRPAIEQGGLLDLLRKALTERALDGEMDHHLAGEHQLYRLTPSWVLVG